MAPPSWHDRLFARLLRMFPAEFRGDFGQAMAEDFQDQRMDAARQGGRRSVLRVWLLTVGGFLRGAPREHLEIFRRDAGYALRLLRRRPALAATALLTLIIGIGLNSAIFSVVRSVLLRPLPSPDSQRVVRLYEVTPSPEVETANVSSANFLDWQRRARTVDAMASIGTWDFTVAARSDPERIACARVTSAFFTIFPTQPIAGRLFVAADFASVAYPTQVSASWRMQDPEPGVAILSRAFWERQFHGDRTVIGTSLSLERRIVEIVGVVDPAFAPPGWSDADCWLPNAADPDQRRARSSGGTYARLATGVSLESAQAEFSVISAQLAAAYPKANSGYSARVTPLLEAETAHVETQLWFLFAAVGCVLLIACANVVNLLLTHAAGRRQELATRTALGATRAHLVRQAVTEGLVLGVAGGSAGLLIAWLTLPTLVALAPAAIPRLDEVRIDSGVFLFTAAVSILVGVACGLASSLSIDGTSLTGSFRALGTGRSGRAARFRQGLTVAEIALALMLVVAAGLLVRTMRSLGALELGFNPEKVIAVGLSPDAQKYKGPAKALFEAELIARVRAISGVVAAGIGSRPLNSGGFGSAIALSRAPQENIEIAVDAVGPGYLEALGAKLEAGRFISEADTPAAPAVALVNRTAAQRFWPAQDAVGQRILLEQEPVLVIGIVADVRRGRLEEEPDATLYLPSGQTRTFWTNNMLVRTSADPRDILPEIRAVMRQLDPQQALMRIETLEERLSESTAPRRFNLRLVGLFSVVALALAMLGIFGVVAESVAQRVPEIGVRLALGARGSDIVRMILGQGIWMVVVGILLGAAGAAALNGVMSGLVFGVRTIDPASYTAAAVCLIASTLFACVIPARRAARIDPVRALRQD
jgi:putative ABC transport system permease protein